LSILTQSLQRLYKAGRLTREQIGERVKKGTITEADYEEITEEAYAAQIQAEIGLD
jgi:hypothetical protein